MKIYTKTGDKGQTSLYKGGRVSKDEPRLAAYGTLDEVNSQLGLALSHLPLAEAWAQGVKLEVQRVQKELFSVGAQLATLGPDKPAWHIEGEDIMALEHAIDSMEESLTPLSNFILPGGHPTGAGFHIARTVTRRAEREIVGLQQDADLDPLIVQYVNRLSDYLFVLARYVNMRLEIPEAPLLM
jgi:cob(I)alamin adenosyltransferase